MAQVNADLLKRSVTRDDTETAGSFHYWIWPGLASDFVSMPYDPPPYWSRERDAALRAVYRAGGQWASAVNIAITRFMVSGYELDGDVKLRVSRAREMLGAGWIDLLQQTARDYLTTDNGAFVEIVRATKGAGSKVLGLVRLSSARCIRTGDVDIPVIYADRRGKYHELKSYQVADFSDMPEDDFYGVGLSATSRAWEYIYEHRAVSAYFKEKATGRRPLSLEFLSGMGDKAIEQALSTAQDSADARGVRSYMGVAITGNANPVPLTRVSIPLASLPDGFSQDKHEELSQIRFANALGIDPSDLNPRLIGNRQLGAGSQAQVLDDKQDSKGLIALRKKFTEFLNDTERWHVLPGGVTFAWSERDLRDQQARAGIEQTRAATRASMIADGTITAPEARQLAVDSGDLPESFIQTDLTTEETLTDEDKAQDGAAAPVDAEPAPEAQPDAQAPAQPPAAPASAGVTLAEIKAKEHSGAMVALLPDEAGAGALNAALKDTAWPEGATLTPADEWHVTLTYLGEAAEIDEARRAEMRRGLASVQFSEPIAARFNGVARFNGSEADGDAIVILLDSDKLNMLARYVRDICGSASAHGFNAHITLAYIAKDAPTPTVAPPFETINLSALTAHFAGEVETINGAAPVARVAETIKKALAAYKAAPYEAPAGKPTEIVAMAPTKRAGRVKSGYWEEVTKELEEYARLLTISMRQHCPQAEGETARSIKWKIDNRNSAGATMRVYVGKKDRPEVAIRSVLFGRRGFGPKRKGVKALRWYVGGQPVFAKKVRGVLANDWLERAWNETEPQRAAMEERLARSMDVAMIDVSDIPGAIKRTQLSQIKAPATKKRRKKKG